MNLEIKSILERIESNGYEAYVVGGYVRDFLLGIQSVDVDICTNALPKDIIKIFKIKKAISSYGSISLSNGIYNFDITTYRKEYDYQNRKPQRIEYTNNLISDIKRRDFTINAICMNEDGAIFDYLNGMQDINDRIIRVIGDTTQKLTEDPLRILRALRFAVVLDFKLDKEIENFIHNNNQLIKNLSYTRKKEELDKILSSKNALKGLKMLKDYQLCNELDIKYDKIVYVNDLLGMWAQIDFSDKYPFTKNNLTAINKIRNIINYNVIDNKILFENDLYTVIVAGTILGIKSEKINQMYNTLPIKSKADIVINHKDIIRILHNRTKINIIENDIIEKILNNELSNNYDKIKEYLLNNWK